MKPLILVLTAVAVVLIVWGGPRSPGGAVMVASSKSLEDQLMGVTPTTQPPGVAAGLGERIGKKRSMAGGLGAKIGRPVGQRLTGGEKAPRPSGGGPVRHPRGGPDWHRGGRYRTQADGM